MKKYWFMSFLAMFVIVAAAVVVRTSFVQAIESPGTSRNLEQHRPTMKPLFEPPKKPTINPTEYILKLTESPRRPTYKPPAHVLLDKKPFASPSGMLAEKKELRKIKLADEKLRKCLSLSKNVTKRSEYLVKSVTEVEKKFTSIVNGVKEYYVKKNLSLVNYDALIAAIESKEKAVAPLLEKAKGDVAAFSCTADDPHAQLKLVDTDVRAVLKALQEYRTSIHAFITAVKGLPVVEATVTAVPTATQ